jgi:hypothetical protein
MANLEIVHKIIHTQPTKTKLRGNKHMNRTIINKEIESVIKSLFSKET